MQNNYLALLLIFVLPAFAYCQMTQGQIDLLTNRIVMDNATISADEADITTDESNANAAITVKQNEINTLNAEMQGALQYLSNEEGANWTSNEVS